MSLAATIDAMVEAGCSTEQIAAVARAHEEAIEKAATARRAKAAARKARWRANNVHGSHGDSTGRCGTNGDTPSPKERSPTPPKEITPSPSSLRSVSVGARDAFEREFWPVYPHKVGKPAAEKSFERLYREMGGNFGPILRGLERYVRDKPADRPWLNPATFLNQRRFDDQPATPPARAGPQRGRTVAEMAQMDLTDTFGFDHERADPNQPHARNGAAEGAGDPDQGRRGFVGRLSVADAETARRSALVDHDE